MVSSLVNSKTDYLSFEAIASVFSVIYKLLVIFLRLGVLLFLADTGFLKSSIPVGIIFS